MCTFTAIAKAHAGWSHQDAGSILTLELQHLCTAVRRANARAVLSWSALAAGFVDAAVPAAIAIVAASPRLPLVTPPLHSPLRRGRCFWLVVV